MKWIEMWAKKLRGALGLGAVGLAGGAVAGVLWSTVTNLLAYGTVYPGNVLYTAEVWGSFGAFVCLGFGGVLGAIGDEIDLERFPRWQAAFFGAAVGSAFPTAVLYLPGTTLLSGLFPALPGVAAQCAALGGLAAATVVAVAKADRSAELAPAPDVDRLPATDDRGLATPGG